MGQIIETILTSLAQALGIETAKFALGDVFPFLVVTGMVWFGAVAVAFGALSYILPKREWNDPVPFWEKIVVFAALGGVTIGVWWLGVYVLMDDF